MHNDADIPLPKLPRALRDACGDAPSYGAVYRAVLDGTIPARQDRGRWYVARTDLPKVAELFDLAVA